MISNLFFLLSMLIALNVNAQESVDIYAARKSASITIYQADSVRSTRTAVLIIPGGAYNFLATETEGIPIAKAFAEKGITAFVLKYCLPGQVAGEGKSTAPLEDGQQAIKLIRQNAAKWKIDPNKLGVIGFSAGGHLASMLETKFGNSYIPNSERINLRPDFAILVYPVITMDEGLTHMGSRINLLGEHPPDSVVMAFSSEKQVRVDTPPTYITHAADDGLVDVHNSIVMYEALIKNKVPAELHLYPKGDHGFIQGLPVNEWLDPILLFIKKQGFY